jgi:hypothetical protein
MIAKVKASYSSLSTSHPSSMGKAFAISNTLFAAWAFYSASKVQSISGGNLSYYRGLMNTSLALSILHYQKHEIFPTHPNQIRVILTRLAPGGLTIN